MTPGAHAGLTLYRRKLTSWGRRALPPPGPGADLSALLLLPIAQGHPAAPSLRTAHALWGRFVCRGLQRHPTPSEEALE